MTRVTNFGRKRTYLEAGFDLAGDDIPGLAEGKEVTNESVIKNQEHVSTANTDGEPPKKKKRIRKKKPKTNPIQDPIKAEGDKDGTAAGVDDGNDAEGKPKDDAVLSKKALKKKRWREIEKQKKQQRLTSSEMRRQKRINEHMTSTTCFACREKGHVAKDCPTTKSEGIDGGTDKGRGESVVGLCYRCGSTRHTLSRCKKLVDESNPLPFASCFVCNGKGHLASSCPQNQERGIYPNGGCCKLCGEKTHLARDCDLGKRENVDSFAIVRIGERPGADEDDFHTFKRQEQEVNKEVKPKDLRRKSLQHKTGAQSNIVKSFESTPKPAKKVVYF